MLRFLCRQIPICVLLCCAASSTLAQDQIFSDIPVSSQYYHPTRVLYAFGITSGCDPSQLTFCVSYFLTRQEMAVFIIRAWSLRLWNDPEAFRQNSPPSPNSLFDDVPQTNPNGTANTYVPYINKMYELGITSGCGSGTSFCPGNTLQNYQIAVFVTRARSLIDNSCASACSAMNNFSYNPNPYFLDVPGDGSNTSFKYIQRLVDIGAVSPYTAGPGCSVGYFCETVNVSRGTMASHISIGAITASYGKLKM